MSLRLARLAWFINYNGEFAGLCEEVEVIDVIIRMFGDEQTHHMAADETGASGDKYVSFSHIESGSAFEKIPRAKLQQKSMNAKKRQSPPLF